jgi:hypothetical protein
LLPRIERSRRLQDRRGSCALGPAIQKSAMADPVIEEAPVNLSSGMRFDPSRPRCQFPVTFKGFILPRNS